MKTAAASTLIAFLVLLILWIALPEFWLLWAFTMTADVAALSLIWVLHEGPPEPRVRL